MFVRDDDLLHSQKIRLVLYMQVRYQPQLIQIEKKTFLPCRLHRNAARLVEERYFHRHQEEEPPLQPMKIPSMKKIVTKMSCNYFRKKHQETSRKINLKIFGLYHISFLIMQLFCTLRAARVAALKPIPLDSTSSSSSEEISRLSSLIA